MTQAGHKVFNIVNTNINYMPMAVVFTTLGYPFKTEFFKSCLLLSALVLHRYQSLRKPDMAVILHRVALSKDTKFQICFKIGSPRSIIHEISVYRPLTFAL
jgi:hypothetical protein